MSILFPTIFIGFYFLFSHRQMPGRPHSRPACLPAAGGSSPFGRIFPISFLIISGFLLQGKEICVINRGSRNAKNGKIGCFLLSERAGQRLKACLGSVPLVRPGAAPERGTVVPPLREMKCVSKDANAGGTAEGLPFVPTYWDERLFCFLFFWRHTWFRDEFGSCFFF